MNYVAEGYNSFETKKTPSEIVKYLPDPKSVIALIQSGKLKEHILLVQGGTTTFLAPALSIGLYRGDHDVGRAGVSSRHPLSRIPNAVRYDGVPHRRRISLRHWRK